MKRITLFLLTVCMALPLWAKANRQTVVFDVDIHCQGCITKIEKNIAFERGVKDLRCDLKTKTVTLVFDPAKTDVQTLLKAFEKINKPATVHLSQDKANGPSGSEAGEKHPKDGSEASAG